MLRSALQVTFCRVLRVFFRRLETTGREHVPTHGPVLFVVNHPNALVDGLVLNCRAGRRVSFLAKEPLFRMPILGSIIRMMDAIPVYRHVDKADVTQNRRTFAAARDVLARDGTIAIFPEGRSHSEPQLLPFRTGAARIALGAVESGGLQIVPAGLFYTDKTKFRSAALLCFGPPIRVTPVPLDADGEPPGEAVRTLTEQLATELGTLTVQADRHEALELAESAERILSIGHRDLAEIVQVRQRLVAGYARMREEAPVRMARLHSRITRYTTTLEESGLTPGLMPVRGYRAGVVARIALRATGTLLIMLPLAVAGMVIHAPAWFVVQTIARRYEREHADAVASIKTLGGVLFYPLTWLLVGWLVARQWGWPWGFAAALSGPVFGYAAMRFLERFDRLAGGTRGVLLAMTGKRRFLRLVAERKAIRDELMAMAMEYGL
jgi:glycerol-3-phosphate O-acyltransferase/dihydroxyacetone phosphate acyltransferase